MIIIIIIFDKIYFYLCFINLYQKKEEIKELKTELEDLKSKLIKKKNGEVYTQKEVEDLNNAFFEKETLEQEIKDLRPLTNEVVELKAIIENKVNI